MKVWIKCLLSLRWLLPENSNMQRILFICLLLFSGHVWSQTRPASLEQSFRNPGPSAKPWIFWYWMHGAVSREGIRADLEAMRESGIGGAYLMPIKDTSEAIAFPHPVRQLTPGWWQMVGFAMSESKRLGLQLAMHVSDGFALAGGPWISPEMSMQKVVWSATDIQGGAKFNAILPLPPVKENYYRDIAVYAYPAQAVSDAVPVVTVSRPGVNAQFLADTSTRESFRSDDPCWIQYAYDQPITCRNITIRTSGNNYQSHRLIVQASDDGRNFRYVTQLEPPRHGWQDGDADVTHAIVPTTAKFFRFVYDKKGSAPGAEDLDAAKWKPVLKVRGIALSAQPRIHQYEGKSGAVWRISKETTTAQIPDADCIPAKKIINITQHLQADGRLQWTPPPGSWRVLRIGHTSTGHKNETAGAGKGLECDKFNPAAVQLQFDNWFGKAFEEIDPQLVKEVLKVLHVDSWECGSQNWSPVFEKEFRRRRGYDLLPYLPVMTGLPVQSAAQSEKVLHDIRQTVADLVKDVFYGTLKKLAHEKGCLLSAESVAPTMLSDGLLHYSNTDIPMGEFWLNSPTHDKPNDMLDAISGAHIYGKRIIQAEGFTTLRMTWNEHPGMLKTLQDRNYALGVNKLVYHVFTHNPWTDRKPGMTLDGVGLYFQRDQTWWKAGKAWVGYAQRCQALLQTGDPVTDIAVFTGEELPRRALLPDRLVAALPGIFGAERVQSEAVRLANEGEPLRNKPDGVTHSANMADPEDWVNPLRGYKYDSFNPDALFRLATVKNGRIVLPGGASYQLLLVPGTELSPLAKKRLQQLVRDGATLLLDTLRTTIRQQGKGRLIHIPYAAASFASIGIERDMETTAKDIAWTHRRSADADIYFISNQQEQQREISLSLRIKDKVPQYWDPVTGDIRNAQWTVEKGRTVLSCELPANGSIFIVFRKDAGKATGTLPQRVLDTLDGNWTVHFDTSYGGPLEPVTFSSLQDWAQHEDSTVRYYSGTAIYRKTFLWHGTERAWLNLGKAANIATVKINGIDCGTAWTPPFRLEITKALKQGTNELEIEVTNTWMNRLIGDHRLPEHQRRTYTTAPWRLDGKLPAESGLLGPVEIETE